MEPIKLKDDECQQQVIDLLLKKQLVIFVGAGFSRDAGIPTAAEIINDLKFQIYCREHPQSSSESISIDFLDEYFQKFLSNIPEPEHYAAMLKRFSSYKSERREILEKYFESAKPCDGHFVVAELLSAKYLPIVITTNFDRLIEYAFVDITNEMPLVFHSEYEFDRVSLRADSPRILKLHGDFLYDDIANLDEEMAGRVKLINEQIKEELVQKSLLVVGYSGNDKSVMSLLERLVLDKQYLSRVYWLQYGDTISNLRISKLLTTNSTKQCSVTYLKNVHVFFKQISGRIFPNRELSKIAVPTSTARRLVDLKTQLQSEPWYSHYITRQLHSVSDRDIKFPLEQIDDESTSKINTEAQILASPNRIILVHGPAGSGKTVLLKKIALECINTNSTLPIFVELRKSLYDLSEWTIPEGTSEITYLFDGVDEVISKPNWKEFKEWINERRNLIRIAHFVFTIRTSSLKKLLLDWPELDPEIMMITEISAYQQKAYIKKDLGDDVGDKLLGEMPKSLMSLCALPLFLNMLCQIYKKFNRIPSNKASLYQEFVHNFLYNWQQKSLGRSFSGKKIEILEDVAFELKNYPAQKHIRIENIIEDVLRRKAFWASGEVVLASVQEMAREFLYTGILQETPTTVIFMHDSIMDFLVGNKLYKDELDVHIYCDKRDYDEVFAFYSGLLDDSSKLVEDILEYSGHEKVQHSERVLLAATCLVSSKNVQRLSFNRLFRCVEHLDNIDKNMFLNIIISLREDRFAEFASKILDSPASSNRMRGFAMWIMQQTRTARSADLLISLLSHYNSEVRWRAASALGAMKGSKAFEKLVELLHDPDESVQGEVIRALGELNDKRAIDPVLKILAKRLFAKERNEIDYRLSSIKSSLEKLIDKSTVETFWELLNPDLEKVKSIVDRFNLNNIEKAIELLCRFTSTANFNWGLYYITVEKLKYLSTYIPEASAKGLIFIIANGRSDDVVIMAIQALSNIPHTNFKNYFSHQLSLKQGNDRQAEYSRYSIALAIRELGLREATDLLNNLSNDQSSIVRFEANEALKLFNSSMNGGKSNE